MRRTSLFLVCCSITCSFAVGADREGVDYGRDIAPLFTKYCAGCHNDADRDGEFSLESYASLLQGTGNGPAVLPTDPEGSRLVRVMTGAAEPQMPPEGEAAPTEAEVALIRQWIEQGAAGPEGAEPDRLTLRVPEIESKTQTAPIVALDISPDGDALAVARYGEVTIYRKLRLTDPQTGRRSREWQPVRKLDEFPGKVNSVKFCLGGGKLLTGSGVAGSGGIATLWEWPLGKRIRDFKGHRDILFDAEISPDGNVLATCSYDRRIILWDVQTGEQLRSMDGHNGAVYDLAFSPDGGVLASASADDTCKLWRVRDGARLDTLGQPQREQYAVTFSPDGRFIAGAGADNRIRIWRFLSKERPKINPLVHARFAHEGPIVQLAYTPDGTKLVSVAEDRTIKVWETERYTELELIENEPEVAMALAVAPNSGEFTVGRMDGSLEHRRIRAKETGKGGRTSPVIASRIPTPENGMSSLDEQEPNDRPDQAQPVSVPATVSGTIHNESEKPDQDCFRFSVKKGEEWVVEVNAARSKSPLDSFIEVLTEQGEPIERVLLQAVRDSYFTFRGKNADQANDFRIFNWEEMELNEYLYANGEVVKLWLYPRGPDSGFNVYPGSGKRWGYFDTTPLSHALGEPCYIVRPHPPGTELIPSGLPVFPLYYENDDESRRELGTDSKLNFTAPADGNYVVRIRDVRGYEGEDFKYTLIIRPRKPDFSVNLADRKLTVSKGSASELRFTAKRLDQYDGPIEINVSGLPEGYAVTSPITVEEGQIEAAGVIAATAEAAELDAEALKEVKITARSEIDGEQATRPVKGFEELTLSDKLPLTVRILPASGGAQPVNEDADGPLEFVVHPGETIMLKVAVQRNGFDGEIPFGTDGAGRNLPHGVYVDNIGLNGLLLLSDQDEREFFITAAPFVTEQTRIFHLKTGARGGHASQPVVLHVRPRGDDVAAGSE